MNKIRAFLILSGYQLTWLACVFGEITYSIPYLGILIGVCYLILFFYFVVNKIRFLLIAILISLPGYFFDTLMVHYKVYTFNTTFILGTLPFWMIVLWLSFATLFDEILLIFKKYKVLGILLSGILGPVTYYLGQPIGVLTINNLLLFFIFSILFWSILMFYYLNIILNKLN